MDKDFHFSTVYVLARWAGFNPGNTKAIATSSQFVDDNVLGTAPVGKRISGHEVWQNIVDLKDNNEVWIPFHFLPGLEGTSISEKLVCKKNSVFANKLISSLPDFTDNISLFQLGIALHVFADTWAHREFSGVLTNENTVNNFDVTFPDNTPLETLIKKDFVVSLPPLGHANAGHLPDLPYISWQCNPTFQDGRNNWDEFTEAAQEIYKVLASKSQSTQTELTIQQIELLHDAFRTIQYPDFNARNDEWIRLIGRNEFAFSDFSDEDKDINYSPRFILDDENFPDQFYEALDNHYNLVNDELNDNGININESFSKFI